MGIGDRAGPPALQSGSDTEGGDQREAGAQHGSEAYPIVAWRCPVAVEARSVGTGSGPHYLNHSTY